jgi:hypothetical protein
MTAQPGASYYINQNCLADRPEIAAIIARCIATWSLVEVELSLILAALLDTRSEAAVAVFMSLRQANVQREAIKGAGSASLHGVDLELLQVALRLHGTTVDERNDLAHGIFGVISTETEKLIWCRAAKFAAWMTRANQTAWNLEFDPDPHAPLREELFIYTKADLEALFAEISFVFDVVSRVHMMLSPIEASSEWGRDWLLAQPRVQGELARIRGI